MNMCEWCDYKENEWLLHRSLHWSVYLADEQDYVGRCILVLNRHCGSLSELNTSEWIELKTIIDRLEFVYKEVLGAELSNWSCLLNKQYLTSTYFLMYSRNGKEEILNGNFIIKMLDDKTIEKVYEWDLGES